MPAFDEIQNLQAAIAALEAQRAMLGDAVIETALRPLRERLAVLTVAPDERKRVTVLFADVSGFTAMSEHLDPEDVTTIMNRCFERLSTEITDRGGTVDKYSGDAVMALFGAPRALENHEEMGVRAALAMQEALATFSAELESERGFCLRMRIGLNTGEVLAGLVGGVGDKDYTVMGDAVNLASRLEHACPVGRVMISAVTAHPLHPIFDFEPPQQITVKGKTEPVTVYLVVGPKVERGQVRGLTGLTAPMIGREVELATLQAVCERAQSERRWQAAAVIGEAGIGKTRLRREFLGWLARFHPETRILTARCYSHTQATPYYLVGTLMQALFGIGPEDDAAAILTKLKEGLLKRSDSTDPVERDYWFVSLAHVLRVSVENDPLLGLEPQQRLSRVFLSLERILVQAARTCPTVIVVEDLHWMDDLSFSFLERWMHIISQDGSDDQPAMLLIISRPPEDAHNRLGQFLTRFQQTPYPVLMPHLLDEAQSRRLLAELFKPAALPSHIESLIVERALGNPFFIEEIVRLLMEEGTLQWDEGTGLWRATRAVADLRVPENVQGVLAARLDRLPQEDKHVAQHAAVIGRTFWQRLLAEITGQAVDATLARLEDRQFTMRLTESQIAEDWEWLFRHVLVQQVAYASVTKAIKRSAHGKVARWLEQHAGDRLEAFVPQIAYHYEQAEVHDRAVHYLLLAAEQARLSSANHKAVEFSTRALALARDDLTRFDLLNSRQKAYYQLGARDAQWADLQEMLRLAERQNDDHRRAQTLNNMGVAVRRRHDLAGALTHHEQALVLFRQVDDHVGAGRCLNNMGTVYWMQGKTAEALAHYEQALQVARQFGELRDEGNSLNNIGTVHWQTGDYSLALEFYRRALLIHQQTRDRYNESIAHTNIGEVCRRLGYLAQAVDAFQNGLSICRAIGDQDGELYALHQLGLTYTDLGQFDQGMTQHQMALRMARQVGDQMAEANAHYGMGLAYLHHQEWTRAIEELNHACALYEELDERGELAAALSTLSRAYLALDDLSHAAECSARALEMLRDRSGEVEIGPSIYWQHYQVLAKAGNPLRQAQEYLESAYHLLIEQAGRISNASDQQAFLNNIIMHHDIVQAHAVLPPVPS